MTVYNCKCKNCKAEFQAILEKEDEVFECPGCNKTDIERKASENQPGCGGGCQSCPGCH